MLRPLGMGEILDRAVTLSVRNFLPLAAAYVLFQAAHLVIEHYAHSFTLSSILREWAFNRAFSYTLAHFAVASPWFWISSGFEFFVSPLAAAALIVLGAEVYRGDRPPLLEAFRRALRLWRRFVPIEFLSFLAGEMMFAGPVVALTSLGSIIRTGNRAGVLLGALGFVAAVVSIVVSVMVVVACFVVEYGYYVERRRFVDGVVVGLRRTIYAWRRSLAAGLAMLAVLFGLGLVGALIARAAAQISHIVFLDPVINSALFVAIDVFLTMFGAVFYFDLRVRQEGFDLEVAASQQTATRAS